MKSESQLIATLWDLIRDNLPAAKRLDIAISMLKTFEDYGFEPKDMYDIVDEDLVLKQAFEDLFDEEDYMDFDEEQDLWDE